MKHNRHETIETHEEIQSNAPMFGDVSGWARGRTMPAINAAKLLEPTEYIHVPVPTRDSAASSLAFKQKIKARLDREHKEMVANGIREAKAAMRRPAPKTDERDIDTSVTVGEFFANLYSKNIERTRAGNAK